MKKKRDRRNPTFKDLEAILEPYVDFQIGETGDCPELDEVLDEVVSWKVLVTASIKEKTEKSKRKMGGDLAYYMDVREILGRDE